VGSPHKYTKFLGYRQEECAPGGCMTELCLQLAIILIGKQALNMLTETGFPYVGFNKIILAMCAFALTFTNCFVLSVWSLGC